MVVYQARFKVGKLSLSHNPTRRSQDSVSEKVLSRLRAEAKTPYRSLRQFIYLTFAASTLMGGFIFFFKLLAGEAIGSTLPNLALQVSIFTLMVWLFRLEQGKS